MKAYKTNIDGFYKYDLIAILILAMVLRLIGIDRSFSNDELSALSRLQFTDFSSLISQGVMPDGHPAFVQVFLWCWIKVFPMTETSIRLPFVICSLFTLYYTYRLAELISDKKVGILVISLMAVSAYYIDYSWLARPYGFGFLWSILSFYFGIKAIQNNRIQHWVLYILYTVFAMYTHYFSFLSVLVFGISLLVFLKEKNRKYLLVSGIVCVLLFLPHLSITLHQLSTGGVGGWLGKPENVFLFQYIFALFNNSWLYLVAFIIVYAWIFLKEKLWESVSFKNIPSSFKLVFSTFFSVFFIGFFYSKYVNAVLQYSVLIFCSPLLFICLFFILKNASVKAVKLLTGTILAFGLISLVFPKSYYEVNRFAVFKDIAEQAKTDLKKDADTKIFFNGNDPFYFQFYAKGIDSNKWDYIHFDEQYSLKNFEEEVSKIKDKNLIYAWSNVGNPPTVLSLIQTYFPYPVHHYYWHNSEYFLFSKDSSTQEKDFYFSYKIPIDTSVQSSEFTGILETAQYVIQVKAFSYLVFDTELDFMEKADLENTFLVMERINNKTKENIFYSASPFELKNGKYIAKVGASIDNQNNGDVTLKAYIWNKNRLPLKIISSKMERWKENKILY